MTFVYWVFSLTGHSFSEMVLIAGTMLAIQVGLSALVWSYLFPEERF